MDLFRRLIVLAAVLLFSTTAFGESTFTKSSFGGWKSEWIEPRIGFTYDFSEATASGYSAGPVGTLRLGLLNGRFFSALDAGAGVLFGFASGTAEVVSGALAFGYNSVGLNHWRASIGPGTEKIYSAYTPKGVPFPWAVKMNAEFEYLNTGGGSYGVDVSWRAFSVTSATSQTTYYTTGVSFFMAFL